MLFAKGSAGEDAFAPREWIAWQDFPRALNWARWMQAVVASVRFTIPVVFYDPVQILADCPKRVKLFFLDEGR